MDHSEAKGKGGGIEGVKFIILNDSLYIDDIPIVKSNIRSVSEETAGEVVYEADESIRDKLKVLEELGFIKEIKSEQRGIKTIDDIIRHTEEVFLLEGGDIHIKVKLLGKVLSFTESQLLDSKALRMQLLRLKEVIQITKKEWNEILSYWFGIAKETNELSEEEEIITKVLNYLGDCAIFRDVNLCAGMFSLYFESSKPDCIFCQIDDLVEFLKFENRRKLRSILSDYILESRKFTVNRKRKHFWGFDAPKSEINFENQLKEEEIEKEERDEQIREEPA